MWRDIRGALRNLARRPGFALAVLATLGLGIGANSAVFTVVNAVLLRDLPFTSSERLVSLEGSRRIEGVVEDWMHSYLNFADLREHTDVFEELAVFSESRAFNLTVAGETRHVWGEMVSANYFELLGMQPVLGRGFTVEEAQPPAGRNVAVISHDLWQRYYEGQRALGERTIRLIDNVFEVIGVAPPGFHGLGDKAEIWVPVTTVTSLQNLKHIPQRGVFWLLSAARLREGVGLRQAQSALDAALEQLESDHPLFNRGLEIRLVPLQEAWFGELQVALLSLMGGAGFVLLIACTNVSNLLLARALERQRELAVRTALGAGRWRLVRQLLTESVALALAGCGLGLLLAHWTTDLLINSSTLELPQFIDAGIDLRVIGLMASLSVVCGLGFGLVPAFTSSRLHLAEALKEGAQGGAGSARHRFQSALIVGEILLAFLLLAGATHALREFENLRSKDLGFRSENLVTLRLDLSGQAYYTREAKRQIATRLLDGLASFPEAEAIALAGPILPIDTVDSTQYSVENLPDPVLLQYHLVSAGYFDLLGIEVLEGRGFLSTDVLQSLPVAIISEDLAKRLFPNESALDRRIKPGTDPTNLTVWLTIVGVVAKIDQGGFGGTQDYPDVYFHIQQYPPLSTMTLNLMMRTLRVPDADLVTRLRDEVQRIVPDLPAYDVLTIEQRLAEQIANERFLVLLMSLFTGLALVLAAVGIYGLLAYVVAQKNRDFGIRLALGSRRIELFRRVIGEAAKLAALGVAVGAVLSLLLRTLLTYRSYQLIGADPVIFGLISALLLALALGASFMPAWRATRIDPNSVLREE